MLSKADKLYIKDSITDIVNTILATTLTPDTTEVPVVEDNKIDEVDANGATAAADQAEATLLSTLASGARYTIVRGRRGTRMINTTQQALDTIKDWRDNRKNFGSSTNIR